MNTIRIIRETYIQGEHMPVGTVVEVRTELARQLVTRHIAERVSEAELAAAEEKPQGKDPAAPAPAAPAAPAPAPAKK